MRRLGLISTMFFILTLLCSGVLASDYITINEDEYRFKIPKSFKHLEKGFCESLRQMSEKKARELYRTYYGVKDNDQFGIPTIFGFSDQPKKIMFFMWVLQIPPQANDYIKVRYSDTIKIIEWGKKTGKVKTVYSNELVKYKYGDAHKADLLMGSGFRSINFTFLDPRDPGQVIQLTVFLKETSTNDKVEEYINQYSSNFEIVNVKNKELLK